MPVNPFTELVEVADYIFDTIVFPNYLAAGFRSYYYGDKRLVNGYPFIIVDARHRSKQRHATGNQFRYDFQVILWIGHGNLKESTGTRTRNELLLVQTVDSWFDGDRKLGGHIVDGFVTSQEAGQIGRRQEYVKGTRMIWEGASVG